MAGNHSSSPSSDIDTLRIPRPRVAFGTDAIPADLADATYLRRAARELQQHRPPADPHVLAAVVKLLTDVAHSIDDNGNAVVGGTYSIAADVLDPRNTVMVVDHDGRGWRVHREAADPEHRSAAYRLAAGWFGNVPADLTAQKS